MSSVPSLPPLTDSNSSSPPGAQFSMPEEASARIHVPQQVVVVTPLALAISTATVVNMMPNLPIEITMEIFHLVPISAASDSTTEFLRTRGAVLLSCRLHNRWVRNDSRWWSRIIISPRIPLHFVLECFFLACAEVLIVVFKSTLDADRPISTSINGRPCTFGVYLEEGVEILSDHVDQFEQLVIIADSTSNLARVLNPMHWTKPRVLQTLLVSFPIDTFEDFKPPTLSNFRFASDPPFGPPFSPFTSLTWKAADVAAPTVTFKMRSCSECSVEQPRGRLISWDDIFLVFTQCFELDTLIVDGIGLDYIPLRTPSASFPIFSLRVLEVTLHGDESLTFFISRLQLPALRYFKVVLINDHDVQCLLTCPAILCTMEEFVVVGQCNHTAELETVLSLARRVVTLDLRMASIAVFRALQAGSDKSAPTGTPNFNACPSLRKLFINEVSPHAIKSLVVSRFINRLSTIEYVNGNRLDGTAQYDL